jgi:hypothetical protein
MRSQHTQQEQAIQEGFRHRTQEEAVQVVPMIGLSRMVYSVHQK